MTGEREYTITLSFSSYERMIEELQKLTPLLLPTATPTEEPPATPPEPERRGRHTAEYHKRARAHRAEHPELSYRECYRAVIAAASAAEVEVAKTTTL